MNLNMWAALHTFACPGLGFKKKEKKTTNHTVGKDVTWGKKAYISNIKHLSLDWLLIYTYECRVLIIQSHFIS